MKHFFLTFFCLTAFFSCKKKEVPVQNIRITDLVSYQFGKDKLTINSDGRITEFNTKSLPVKRVILLNASLAGYFTELGLENNIVGISSPEYIFSKKIQGNVNKNLTQNVGNEQKFNVEKIFALKPDVIFTNYISTFQNTYKILENQGIKIVFLDEYREQNPLHKTAYLKIFGMLFDKKDLAEKKYGEIKNNYDAIKASALLTKDFPKVISNEMYGNQWFLPGGKTAFSKMMKDAHADYILNNNQSENAVPMSFEEVLASSSDTKFWVNAGNHKTKAELLAINPNYAKISAFKNGKIYALTQSENGRANDFFESGVVRADLVLKDFVTIFHPELFPTYSKKYMREIH